MATFIALCLEDLDAAPGSPEYLQCVAKPGSQPGLTVDESGRVLWEVASGAAFELWVTADDRLALRRRSAACQVTVSRSERSLAAPTGKPVILLDQDEIRLGSRHWRVHLHGHVAGAHAPRPLLRKAFAPLAAAALTLAGCAGSDAGLKRPPPIELRNNPPDISAPEPPPQEPAPAPVQPPAK